jgi:hypothetical protein
MLPVLVAGSGQYQIKVDEGATICLTANGQIIGFGEGTGAIQYIPVTPQVPGTTVKLTIRKQNYYRYEHLLATIPAEGPYLIFDSAQINDEAGNGNQHADYNETCDLNVSIHNVGSEDIGNITATLSCTNPNVQILQDHVSFGMINSGDILQAGNAFTLHFDESLEDGQNVLLYLQMSNNDYSYYDSIEIKVKAPVLSCTKVSFSNLSGEPTDRFMRGESTLMTFDITNSGHSKSFDLTNQLSINVPFMDITENPLPLEAIEAGETAQVTFQVNLHDDAPKGNILNYTFESQSGVRTIQLEDQVSLGYTVEDFEDEELNPNLQWTIGTGNKTWIIVEDSTATEGHCLRSPTINNNVSAKLLIVVKCAKPETFTFNHKTSTETNDVLQLKVNTQLAGTWSGESDWETTTVNLNQGDNLLTFTYKKNAQDTGGDDCVMIDHLLFPPLEELFVFAGDDSGTDFNHPFTPNSCVLYYDTILWSTSGDGIFDDPSLEKPTYTFGTNDLANGHVTLNLTANRNGVEQSDDIVITSTNATNETILSGIQVYPNPTQGTIHIQSDDVEPGRILIRLIDCLGRTVKTIDKKIDDNTLQEQLNVSNLSSGLYDLQVIQGSKISNTRVIIR